MMRYEIPKCPEMTDENRIQISTWKRASDGDAESQYRMGWYHLNGVGV